MRSVPHKVRSITRTPAIINHTYSTSMRVPSHEGRKEGGKKGGKRKKGIQIGKGKTMLSLFTGVIIIYLENTKEYTNNRSNKRIQQSPRYKINV